MHGCELLSLYMTYVDSLLRKIILGVIISPINLTCEEYSSLAKLLASHIYILVPLFPTQLNWEKVEFARNL